jgi:hypothetical protein
MNISPTYIIHGYNLIIIKRNKLGILDNKFNNFQNFSLYVLCNFPTSPLDQFFWGEVETSKTHTKTINLHNQSLPDYSTS